MSIKTHVVTGASSGIGRATAWALSEAGLHVTVAGRNLREMERLREEANAASLSGSINVRPLDVTTRSSVDSFVAGLTRDGCCVVTLINNAGVSMTRMESTADGFERTWAVNVRGPYMVTKAIAQAGLLARGAHVMNLASKFHARSLSRRRGLGQLPFSTKESYLQSKLSVILMTKALAPDLMRVFSVGVNAVHPGIVKSGLGNDTWFARAIGRTAGLVLPPATHGARRVLQALETARSEQWAGEYIEDNTRRELVYEGDVGADARWLCELLDDQIAHPIRRSSARCEDDDRAVGSPA